jgi:hypothetical protein
LVSIKLVRIKFRISRINLDYWVNEYNQKKAAVSRGFLID